MTNQPPRVELVTFVHCAALGLVCWAAAAQAFQEPPATAKPQPAFKEYLPVPDGTPEEKLEFFKRLKQQRPKFDTQEQALEHAKRVFETIVAASGKLLAGKLTPDQQDQVTIAHFEALAILNRVGDPRAGAPLLAMAEKLKDHKDRELADYARVQLIQAHMDATMEGKPGAAAKLLEVLKGYAAGGKPTSERFESMRTVARALEIAGEWQAALQAYELLGETFAKSSSLDLVAAAHDSAKAAATRIGTIGKKVHFDGTTVDGKPFDLVSLQGKVVLIDFWATWCGPCLRELPNMKKNYEKYHDRGFEVVGISLDEDRSTLENFLRENELPWPTLFSDDTKATQALSDRFGVEGIPAMLLVGRDGKVITLKARGEDLGKELERLLGSK
jgi:thiol-disulfide isomerase/thioredoxin